MPTFEGNLSTATGNHAWEWPDPTASELRRFVERDVGTYLVNALRDTSTVLGMDNSWAAISIWVSWAEEWTTIPEGMKERLLHVDRTRSAASNEFLSLNRWELDLARREIAEVMMWLRAEFPAAGIEYLPDDFGS